MQIVVGQVESGAVAGVPGARASRVGRRDRARRLMSQPILQSHHVQTTRCVLMCAMETPPEPAREGPAGSMLHL
jgi:hypothetical protein